MKAILIAAALLLVGCGHNPPAPVEPNTLPLDPATAERCDPVPDAPPRDTATMGQLLKFSDLMVGIYGECAVRDAGKYDWIKSQGH